MVNVVTDVQKLKYDLALNCARVIVEARHVYKPDKDNAAELYAAMLDEFVDCCRGIIPSGGIIGSSRNILLRSESDFSSR